MKFSMTSWRQKTRTKSLNIRWKFQLGFTPTEGLNVEFHNNLFVSPYFPMSIERRKEQMLLLEISQNSKLHFSPKTPSHAVTFSKQRTIFRYLYIEICVFIVVFNYTRIIEIPSKLRSFGIENIIHIMNSQRRCNFIHKSITVERKTFFFRIIGGFPNTYCFTKALAESMIRDTSDKIPIGVFRPSIGRFTSNLIFS